MTIRRWVAGVAGVAGAAVLAVVSATPAQAFPQGSCGQSYRKVAAYPLKTGAKDGASYGTVTLYQSPTAHRKCAIARVSGAYVGRTKYLYVELFVDRNRDRAYGRGDTAVADGSEKYKWFAGPVYAPADGLCVRFAGAVRVGSGPLVRGGTPDGAWAHCA
ncbi:hypothetical protein AB0L05_08890 [Nonomuraea pusilla]|uniref:hypothetical protein n=1 Tax=Nonomuraea pusilla TaxID=46177 RepID=UPI003332ABEF